MLDGPKVGLIVLALALSIVGLAIYLYERRHGRRPRDQEPKRLPLFGTEQLAIRTAEGDVYDDAPPRPITRHRPAEPPLPVPHRPSSNGSNGRSPAAAPTAPYPAVPPAAPLTAPPVRRTEPAARPPAPPPPAVPAPRDSFRPPAPRPVAPVPVTTAGGGDEPDLAMIEGETLRFAIPSDGTVEFLPGRLEIVAGPESGREIRFVRTPGEIDIEVTFGRSEGPPNRHVQILARTVSRRHAVMSLIDDHWQLTNLSATNPVVLNGRVLGDNEVAPLLVEGDRIEMGEVAFVFHDD